MPDRITSASLTFLHVITPYRTHASNPHHVYCLTDSLVPLISLSHFPLTSSLLRSRPTCHGIRRTVIDIARESLVFHFFCIILRLDPCRTGPFLITDLAPTPSRLIG